MTKQIFGVDEEIYEHLSPLAKLYVEAKCNRGEKKQEKIPAK